MKVNSIGNKAAFVAVTMLLAGCSGPTAVQLRSRALSFDEPAGDVKETGPHFLLLPFSDERGEEFGYIYPSTFIPVASLFHMGGHTSYPEGAGVLKGHENDRHVVSVGSLDQAMPYLLADLMGRMGLTSNAVPLDSFDVETQPEPFDFLVKGRLVKTLYDEQVNIVPLAVLGVLGVPYRFVDYEFEFEVSVFAAGDLKNPVVQKTYTFGDSKVAGAYYNHDSALNLFVAGLEGTLPQAVRDIAAEI